MKEFLNDWGLSLAVFLPVLGAIVMLVIPRKEESAHKWIALLTSRRGLRDGHPAVTNFNYDRVGQLQYVVDKQWIPLINSRYIVGLDGISLPLLALTVLVVPLCIIYSWNHLPEPGNFKAFFILLLILETGMVGTFVAQDLILFFVFFEVVLLPDVLPDRCVGRRAAPVRGDQVLPLHAVRLGADDRQLHRAVPAVRQGPGRRSAGQHLRHAGAAVRRRRYLVHGRALDLRRHVHRLRHQGADLPVPHLAARRAHPGARRSVRSSWPRCS